MQILIVEDEPIIQHLIRDALEHSNARFDIAASATEAIERLDTIRYDVVTVDFHLAGECGFCVLEHIQKTPLDSRPRAIMISAFADDRRIIQEATELGAEVVLPKPIPIRTLREVIYRLHSYENTDNPTPTPDTLN